MKHLIFLTMKKLFLIILVTISLNAFAQDTLRVMYYNLLNFGNFTDFCTVSNNNPESKAEWMKTIVDHLLPDILAVNELSPNSFYHQLILNNVMNTSGRNFYQMSQPTNFAGSDIINLLFYNSQKVGLARQDVLLTIPRDINLCKLYHKSPSLGQGADTTFFWCAVAHFKAGTSGGDQAQRAAMAQAVISFMEQNEITEPFLFMGDLNLYTSNESAWETLTGGVGEYRFSDPLNMAGNWSQNPAYAAVHTQSTRTQSGCGAGAGMDDRFDFILNNPSLTATSFPVSYVEGSYTTIGQDGLRFNQSLVNPPNYSQPAEVVNALFNLSDHLPVVLDLVAQTPQPQFLPDLFFSEYVEGSGNNKALEIFNPTTQPVDLSNYMIARYVNGSINADTVGLAGMLQPGKTYVVVIDKRDPAGTGSNVMAHPDLIAVADTFLCPDHDINPTMYFNGNDAMALHHKNGQLVDLIGKIGENPGAGWTDDSLCAAGAFTALCGATAWTTNHTMVRKFGVTSGVKVNPPWFDVTLQWDTLPMNTFDSLGFHRSIFDFELPDSWNYIQTMNSHIFIVPIDANPMINGQPLNGGEYIGLFFKDGNLERCAGNVQWNGIGNVALVAYGDDPLTSEKEGFADAEELLWKILKPSIDQQFRAEATYSPIWHQQSGQFVSGGISALTSLDGIQPFDFQLELPAGWSGASLPLDPSSPWLEELFGSAINSIKFLSDGAAVFYPEQNINEIVAWQTDKGYYVKTSNTISVLVPGYSPDSRTIELSPGWNLIAVLSQCPVDAATFNSALEGKLEAITDVADVKVYWPAQSITTLMELLPGKSYFVKMNATGVFTFEECD